MPAEVAVRPYRKGDEEKIVELLEIVFNGWPRFDLKCSPLDYWRWKYESNPMKGKTVSVAEHEGKIVGCSHGYYLKVKIGQKSLLAQQSGDLAVSEDYRGMGIFPRLIETRNEIRENYQVDLSFGVTSNPVVVKSKVKIGQAQLPSKIRHMIKIVDTGKFFNDSSSKYKLIKKIGYISLKTLNRLGDVTQPTDSNGSVSNLDILEQENMDDKLEDFWSEIQNDYEFIVERDKSYMNWRYFDERGGNYTLRYAYDENKILGYTVLRINKLNPNKPEGYIVDILTSKDRVDVAKALIQDADRFFTENGVKIIHTLALRGSSYERLFKRSGFIDDRNKQYIFIRSFRVDDLFDFLLSSPPNKIHIVYGDLDWI